MGLNAATCSPSPAWALRLLALAAAWMVLLSVIAAVEPSVASLLPTHTHQTLGGLLPRHTHGTLESSADRDAGCAISSTHQADEHTRVVCGTDNGAVTGAGLLMLAAGPAGVPSGGAITARAPLAAAASYAAVFLALLTPPPRG